MAHASLCWTCSATQKSNTLSLAARKPTSRRVSSPPPPRSVRPSSTARSATKSKSPPPPARKNLKSSASSPSTTASNSSPLPGILLIDQAAFFCAISSSDGLFFSVNSVSGVYPDPVGTPSALSPSFFFVCSFRLSRPLLDKPPSLCHPHFDATCSHYSWRRVGYS